MPLFKFLLVEQAQKDTFDMAPLPSAHHRGFGW